MTNCIALCPNCDANESILVSNAVIAPWIVKLTKIQKDNWFSKYLLCTACDFRYFDYRFSDADMNGIYSDYRGEKYFSARSKWEPWYTRKTMNAWNPDQNLFGVASRKYHLLEILHLSEIKSEELRNVLDFGGDLGQFFPEEIKGEKYLYDPSQPSIQNSNIIRVQNFEGLENKIGLIMNAHTLEHLPKFRDELVKLRPLLAKEGVLYIEVPADAFCTSKFHATLHYLRYLKWLRKYYFLFVSLDFLSGVYRTIFRRIPFWGIVKQSEHINYFSTSSLKILAQSVDLELLRVTEPDLNFGQGRIKLGRISMVLRNRV